MTGRYIASLVFIAVGVCVIYIALYKPQMLDGYMETKKPELVKLSKIWRCIIGACSILFGLVGLLNTLGVFK